MRVNLTGQVPQQYLLGQATVDPPQMTITGAASLVGQATEAVVDVSVAGVTVSINGVYTPRILDSKGNDLKDLNLRTSPPSLSVQVPITQQTLYKEVGVHTVTQGQPAVGYVVQPLEVNPSTATLVGDSAALQTANFVDTAPIDINGISTTIVRSVALAPPTGTLLLQQGQTVTVSADTQEVSEHVGHFIGNVVLTYEDMRAEADEATYDYDTRTLTAGNHIKYTRGEEQLEADHVRINTETKEGDCCFRRTVSGSARLSVAIYARWAWLYHRVRNAGGGFS